jgi:hypothetical protein
VRWWLVPRASPPPVSTDLPEVCDVKERSEERSPRSVPAKILIFEEDFSSVSQADNFEALKMAVGAAI